MVKLSIITINFNNADGLRKTIESVVNQTSTNFEYIIIDGGSTDGSLDIIKAFEDKINYWISEPDSGIYNAMNKGIKNAKGDYCQFLNSGDILAGADVTTKMLANINNSEILIGNMIKVYPNGKTIKDKGLGQELPGMLTFYNGTLNHSPAYIKRGLFSSYGYYDESLKIVSDWKWYLNAIGLQGVPVKYVDLDVVVFNMEGISNTQKQQEYQERQAVLKKSLIPSILSDYDRYAVPIYQWRRINKYYLLRKVFWILDRIAFRIEKTTNKLFDSSK